MKRLHLFALAALCIVMLSPNQVTQLRAQENTTDFLQFGLDNAHKLSTLYLTPLGRSIGTNMNNGWYNTAQAHRTGRFDIRLSIPVTLIGESQRTFRFVESDFQEINLVHSNEYMANTLFGPKEPGPEVVFRGDRLNLPPGTGVSVFPVLPPALQLNIGLVYDTEFMFRFVPEMSIGDFSSQLFGFGIKHGIRQHIPGIALLPFDLSFIAGFSVFEAQYGLNYNPQNDPQINTDRQRLELTATAWNTSLVVSKKLSVVSFFAGIRYASSNVGFLMAGHYPVATQSSSADEIVRNPVDIKINGGEFGLNGGFRLKLGFMSLFADATLANYSSVNAGISLGFHN
ncbi:MAG: DUF6588 family protein [Bacteroidales bacterium]